MITTHPLSLSLECVDGNCMLEIYDERNFSVSLACTPLLSNSSHLCIHVDI